MIRILPEERPAISAAPKHDISTLEARETVVSLRFAIMFMINSLFAIPPLTLRGKKRLLPLFKNILVAHYEPDRF